MSKDIYEWYEKNHRYDYYHNDYLKKINPFKRNVGVNCDDSERVKGAMIRELCVRKATPEEIEWIKQQPKVDINAPENESLKKIIIYLHKIGVFDG